MLYVYIISYILGFKKYLFNMNLFTKIKAPTVAVIISDKMDKDK